MSSTLSPKGIEKDAEHFTPDVLQIDPEVETNHLCTFIRDQVVNRFKRQGAVIGLSGGVDSAVISELLVRALGPDRVLGLILPEKESNQISEIYARKQAGKLGIAVQKVDITEQLKAFGVYEKRDAVIRSIFPEFDDSTHTFNICLPQNILQKDRINYHSITIVDENHNRKTARLLPKDWMAISACQNIKQRTRMINLYALAERNNYLVCGTTNKSEADQGFFVKCGDGGVDIEPIAHLYKTQVFQLARYLGVIGEIINRTPSPDTYSLPVSDQEFYFCLPYQVLDLALYAYEHQIQSARAAEVLSISEEQLARIYKDIQAKARATWHLRALPPSPDQTFLEQLSMDQAPMD
ncbi:MAG: NAD(+) synthase [bacterium]